MGSAVQTNNTDSVRGDVLRRGWAAVADVVRGLDAEKVRGCKEDIDTLLVFAGLFSAVLTAFLVESYKALQEDPDATQVELLKEISSHFRTFSLKESILNASSDMSTQAHSMQRSLRPSATLVHVNVLWFTSLILSLATASLGMLVKQWLREYLSAEYSAPQQLLRVRQYRIPGLQRWKVYEIAAMLPMLLQLALAFFFLGLCLFTSSINSIVGCTSISLITAWLFFFGFSLVAPILFPGCPYRTGLFNQVIKPMRIFAYKGRLWLWNGLESFASATQRWGGIPLKGLLGASRPLLRLATPYDEENAMMNEDPERDVDILGNVDAALMDDDLLGCAIWEAFLQVESDPRRALNFLFETLRRRIPGVTSIPASRDRRDQGVQLGVMDLRRHCSRRTYETVMNVAVTILQKGLDNSIPGTNWTDWMKDAFVILLSRSTFSSPDNVIQLLSRCIDSPYRGNTAKAISDCHDKDDTETYCHILRCLQLPFCKLRNLESVVRGAFFLARGRFCEETESDNNHEYLAHFLWYHQSSLSEPVLHAFISILTRRLRDELYSRKFNCSDPYVWQTIRAILSCRLPETVWPEMRCVLRNVLQLNDAASYKIIQQVCAVKVNKRAFGPFGMTMLHRTYLESEYITRHVTLLKFHAILQSYADGKYNEPDVPLNYLTVCILFAEIYKAHCPPFGSLPTFELVQDWRLLWELTIVAMKRFTTEGHDPEESSKLALEALRLLDEIEETMNSYEETKGRGSLPDDLFSTLAAFVSRGEDLEHFARTRYLSTTSTS